MSRAPAGAFVLLAVAGLVHAAAPAPPASAAPPAPPARALPTREEMESATEPSRMRFVWGTRDPALAPLLHERAVAVARRMFGADSSQVLADRDAREADVTGGAIMLFGGPRQNVWAEKLAAGLPVEFTASGFRWHGVAYERPGDLISLTYPNPRAVRRFLFLVAPNSAAALGRHGGYLLGEDDWRILREGELVRSGSFAQSAPSPWRYDPRLDHDREADRARWQRSLASRGGAGWVVRAPSDLALAAPAQAAVRTLLARLDAEGLGAGVTRNVSLTLYRSIEEKGLLSLVTRPEHVAPDGTAHAAPAAGREAPDYWSVAAARLVALGAAPDSRFLPAAGAWLTGRCDGEPLERPLARLYFGRLLPSAADAATRPDHWRSPLVTTPARALLAHAVWDCAAPSRRRAALLSLLRRDAPGTLDSLCSAAGVPAGRVASRYRALADSLARAGQRSLALRRAGAWRFANDLANGFANGVCLAHDVRLDRGYASEACAKTLRDLRDAGAGWVSLTPFGYVPEGSTEILASAEGGPDEESDEAVCEAAARAHALGLKVWLVPHLWSRGWPGVLEFTPPGWARFHERYREFALHYALLADRERIEGLSIGHEMASSTARDPETWRGLAAAAREVFSGALTYVANWDEAPRVKFWDALDLVAVSFYAPLSANPTRDAGALRAGASRALATLETVAKGTGRVVLLAEVGYAAGPDAPVHPWQEGRGAADPAAQRACYEALEGAMEGRAWIAGALWWKWSSAGDGGGLSDPSYTPQGKPAEAVMKAGWRRDRTRAIRPPAGR